jgi:hypothetical protein
MLDIKLLKTNLGKVFEIYTNANPISQTPLDNTKFSNEVSLCALMNKSISAIDIIIEQLCFLNENENHDNDSEIENVIFSEFQELIDKTEDFEDKMHKATIVDRYHHLIEIIANEASVNLFVKTSELDNLQESRIEKSNELVNDGDDAIDYFDFQGMAIHDPSTDESTTSDVNPIAYYGLPYLLWYNNIQK